MKRTTLLFLLLGTTSAVAAAQTQTLDAGDVRLRYAAAGAGPAVVFIHGWAQDLSIWDEQARALAPHYRVIRFDRRGFGESTGFADPSADPADLLALLDSLRIQRAYLVGLSAGARTALDFAGAFPTRVNGIVYYGGGPVPGFPGLPNGPSPQSLFGEMARAHGIDSVRRFVVASLLFWDPPGRPDLIARKERMMAAYAGRDILDPRAESGRVPRVSWSRLTQLHMPTLIINGDHDFSDFLVVADSMARKMPNARRVVITEGGHGAHFAQPEQFNSALLRFFESVGRAQPPNDARFDTLVALAEAKMQEYGVPGVALGVLHNGNTSVRGLGVTNLEDPLPVTAHTVFPIASISKTFAGTAIMQLVEQGQIDLRAPVRAYVPDFRVRDAGVSRDVTVWHLLTHLGGWEGQVAAPDRASETLKNFVASISDLMQVAPPGAAWSYNNAGFSIAGRVIESVTGKSINRAMRDLVFQPLGLEHAGTTAGDFIVQRFAAGHTTRDGKTTLNRPFTPSASVTAGGVGLCMTDLLAYARFHMGDGTAANDERVLSRASLDAMRAVQARKQSTDDDIGIAWHLRRVGAIRTASHGGTLGGHILLLEIVPERDFAIGILTNANTGWRLIQDVEREALRSYLGSTYATNQAIAHRGLVETLPSVEPLAQQPDPSPYVGTYRRPSNSVVVSADGRRLFVQERPNEGDPGPAMPVLFYGPDRVVVTDGAQRGQSIEFVRDTNGRVDWVRVVGRVALRSP